MKNRTGFAALVLMLVLALPALAEVPAPTGWQGKAMTVQDMEAIYQASFDKMGTTASASMQFRTLADLPEFEKEYTQNTGRKQKEDLVFSSVPTERDMPYEVALDYAKALIRDKFATPEEEQEAMGVYPSFIDYVYMPDESEWEFYFTPRRDTDIDMDHDYAAPGEYRVHFGAQSGRVILCNWYVDDFWQYAARLWEKGKYDVLYQQTRQGDYFLLPYRERAYYAGLLAEAGYDTLREEKAADIGLDKAREICTALVMTREGLTQADFGTVYAIPESYYVEGGSYCVCVMAQDDSGHSGYEIYLEAETGNLVLCNHPFDGHG